MGLLKDSIAGKEPEDEENDPAALEEKYEKLFMKIGRDFVHADDFIRVIEDLMTLLADAGIIDDDDDVGEHSNAGAMSKAVEYKEVIDSGDDGSKIYQDLIKLNEEEDG